jgi:hypothetical protein
MCIAAKEGSNVLFCMSSRTNCILLVLVMLLQGRDRGAERSPAGRRLRL